MTEVQDVPDLLPARMLNEFTYCPRLFFLEWVQSRFVDNDDTVDGRFVHRYADQPAGAPAPPSAMGDEPEDFVARSLPLSSPSLGISARLDVVEGRAGAVRPVERKRGRAPDNPERSWEPERVQVCAQGLLLREHGWRVEEGVLAFAESRERVIVPLDETLVSRTLELLAQARQVAAQDEPPPPLVDSPKCPRCSLVGLCLPDEVNTLAGRQERPRRRLLPRDPQHRPLYVGEQGAVVGRDAGRVVVNKGRDELADVRLIDVSQLCVTGNVSVTTPLLRELFLREVAACWFSYGGWFTGMATGLPSRHVQLRQRQVVVAAQGGLSIARDVVASKIRNCRTLLRRNAREQQPVALERLREGACEAGLASSSAVLLGVEGAAARTYFSALPSMLRPEHRLPGAPFAWDGRNRRPPLDAVNCLLSYVYALLVKDLTVVTTAVGFDPYLGSTTDPASVAPRSRSTWPRSSDRSSGTRQCSRLSTTVRSTAATSSCGAAASASRRREGARSSRPTNVGSTPRYDTPLSVTLSATDDSSKCRRGCSEPICLARCRSTSRS